MSLSPYQHLEKRFKRVQVLRSITHLLRWDSEVLMPLGSSRIRSEQLALLDTECSAILLSKKTAVLLDRVESSSYSLDEWEEANVREMRRHWLYAKAIPKYLMNSLHRATTKAEVVWRRACEENNFKILSPHLEKVVDVVRDKAQFLGNAFGCSSYDALLDEHDPGRKSAEIDPIFQKLDLHLPPLIEKIIDKQSANLPVKISEKIPKSKQKDLGRFIMKKIGFPFNKGRLDESLHPFTEGTSEDLRITSLFAESDFLSGLMGILHETGHAMYDFGLPPDRFFQPVGRDRGMTVHESQALFLEMMIGRTPEFMNFAGPIVSRIFGVSGPAWQPENLYRMATQVRKSFNRMNADEVTYPMHILVRYELEKDIFSGSLRVKDLPDAWNEKFHKRMGIFPENVNQGCLQDSHWPQGYFGYFSTYALGAIMAAQLHRALKVEIPGFMQEIQQGDFSNLFDWLGKKIFQHGAKLSSQELLRQATGDSLNSDFYLDYLKEKYFVDTDIHS
ncbi:MAG: carboxypeptidase M32 [Nitrospinae bacterium CG11_big_fil_rev_8_21_14_0_20_45_15]|nr:MAG: carboxypeptidase M32 [Nitrospinae bacterium CG11_big_fil_rev_8_21_14_0_20_45_15]